MRNISHLLLLLLLMVWLCEMVNPDINTKAFIVIYFLGRTFCEKKKSNSVHEHIISSWTPHSYQFLKQQSALTFLRFSPTVMQPFWFSVRMWNAKHVSASAVVCKCRSPNFYNGCSSIRPPQTSACGSHLPVWPRPDILMSHSGSANEPSAMFWHRPATLRLVLFLSKAFQVVPLTFPMPSPWKAMISSFS